MKRIDMDAKQYIPNLSAMLEMMSDDSAVLRRALQNTVCRINTVLDAKNVESVRAIVAEDGDILGLGFKCSPGAEESDIRALFRALLQCDEAARLAMKIGDEAISAARKGA